MNNMTKTTDYKSKSTHSSYTPDYDKICSYENLYKAYKKSIKSKRNNHETQEFEYYNLSRLLSIQHQLQTQTYKPDTFKCFKIYEPKERDIKAPSLRDKITQHCIVDNVLYEKITRSFIYDNGAAQIGKGTTFSRNRLKVHLKDYYLKEKGHYEASLFKQGKHPKDKPYKLNGYILKCDIHHFFDNIQHDVLKRKLKKLKLDIPTYNLLCRYIDTSKGLPLGYQTSQLLGIFYLDGLDHLIKEQLNIKYYGKYMDDFYLIHQDKKYLIYCLETIKKYLGIELGLSMNKKTEIIPIKNGIKFLGFHFYIMNSGRVYVKSLKIGVNRTLKHIYRYLHYLDRDLINKKQFFTRYHNVMHYLSYADNFKMYVKPYIDSRIDNKHIIQLCL